LLWRANREKTASRVDAEVLFVVVAKSSTFGGVSSGGLSLLGLRDFGVENRFCTIPRCDLRFLFHL